MTISTTKLTILLWPTALDILSRRDNSSGELRDKLATKLSKPEFDAVSDEDKQEAIEQTINKLRSLDLLDDERFARTWIESRIRSHPRGALMLQQELRQKGIEEALTKWLLAELFPEDSQLSAARALIVKRKGKSREQNQRFLASKGFSFAVIREAVEG